MAAKPLLATVIALVALSPLAAAEPLAQDVRLREADWAGVQKAVQARRGRVVAVMIWTSTCEGCKVEFPHFLAMRKRFGDEVALVSVCCDFDGIEGKPPRVYRPDALAFLRERRSTIDNVLLTESFIDFLDRVDLSSTPAVFVYGTNGRLAKRFDHDGDDSFGMKDVADLVATRISAKKTE